MTEEKNIDGVVGANIRKRRLELGLSQSQLADMVGVTFQQIQKYERGTNRVGASRLFMLSEVMDVTVDYFFLQDENNKETKAHGFAEGSAPYQAENKNADERHAEDREVLSLVRAFQNISSEETRKRVIALIRSIGK